MAVYSALYRTWRPRRLADLVGQEHVERTLRNALAAGHAAHAYLFCGPRGTGKTSTARILAAALNCAYPSSGDACGECQPCREVASDRLIDVREIDAASNRQVDDMRALRETIAYAPVAGRHKVYILDEVHMLTDASWNTLLKTLEEPPPATTFVLCTTDPRKVLPTVISRCQRFDFRRLTVSEISAHLSRVCLAENISANPAALQGIARRADGGLRDALSILDQATAFVRDREITPEAIANMLGTADDSVVQRMIDAAWDGAAATVFMEIDRLYGDGKDMGQVLRDVLSGLRDRLVTIIGDRGERPHCGGSNGDVVRRNREVYWLMSAIGTLADLDGQIRRAEQPRLLLEVAMVRMLAGIPSATHNQGSTTTNAEPWRTDERRLGTDALSRSPETRISTSEDTLPQQPVRLTPGPSNQRFGSGARNRLDVQSTDEVGPTDVQGPEADSGWEAFLEALRRHSVPASSTLQGGEFRGQRDGRIQVVFRYPGHVTLAEGKRTIIERVWEQITGTPTRFDFIAGSNSIDPSNYRTQARPVAPPPLPVPRKVIPTEMEASNLDGTTPPPAGFGASRSRDALTVRSRTGAQDVEALYNRALVIFQGTALTAG